MKAAFKGPGGIKFKDVGTRPLKPDEIRLKVDVCGICGTDLHCDPNNKSESRIGHEMAGTIKELGSAVKNLAVGQKVALDSSSACGHCSQCKNGLQELCTNVQSFFNYMDLGFAEEVIAPAISAVPYKGISDAVASLQEPLGVSIDMVRLTDIDLNSNVLLIGAGPIGLMAVALAKRQGARKIFVCQRKRRKARCQIALDWGADAIIDPEELEKYDFGCKIDRIMVTSSPDTIGAAAKIACKGGIITFIGLGFGEKEKITLEGNSFHFKKLQLRASFASPAMFGPMAIEYLEHGIIDGKRLVSHTYPLSELAKGMETAMNDLDAVKVVVNC
ncbi:MAG TPA: hypothetical protein DET40_08285 [Lentisphaeria bacterium]|nr:MAG: hypothetical protein A2X45_10500 [Lentisphaerae bacterium GWF2_50_93]HCE43531.1 hypothetical protein [Lentisphaeria bacterium]